MKTQYYTATSLDGYIATADDSLAWLFKLGDPTEPSYEPFIAEVGALVMGSATYEWILRHMVKSGTADSQPWPYQQPCWVFTSRELPAVTGADIRFVRGDVRPVHAAIRAAIGNDANIWIMGGGELVGQFHDAGLLDELIVTICSALLGEGKPLLPRCITFPDIRLTSVRQIGAQFAELRYDVSRSS